MSLNNDQILASMPIGVLVVDPDGKVLTANPAIAEMLGYNAAGLAGKSLTELSAEGDTSRDDDAMDMLKKGLSPDAYIKEFVGTDEFLYPVEVYASALREDDSITGMVLSVKPLSEEMRLLDQLQRRNMHLLASSEVARAATSILDIQELLERAVQVIRDNFGFYYASIFLIEETGSWAVLRAATSEGGKKLLEAGHKLGVGSQSMVGWVTANNAARIALDVGEEAIRFDNPMLPKTRSEMALPLRVRGEVIGALDVQSTSLDAFSEEDIQTIQMMADQVAIAIDNARLFASQSPGGKA